MFFTQIDEKNFLKLKNLFVHVKMCVEFNKIMIFDFWDFFGFLKSKKLFCDFQIY